MEKKKREKRKVTLHVRTYYYSTCTFVEFFDWLRIQRNKDKTYPWCLRRCTNKKKIHFKHKRRGKFKSRFCYLINFKTLIIHWGIVLSNLIHSRYKVQPFNLRGNCKSLIMFFLNIKNGSDNPLTSCHTDEGKISYVLSNADGQLPSQPHTYVRVRYLCTLAYSYTYKLLHLYGEVFTCLCRNSGQNINLFYC